ncbi:MAG: PAS domain S-box protein [Lysinibacillus sp.]
MILLICTLQVVFIRKMWSKQEQSSVDRENEQSSKESYLQLFFQNADDAISVFDLDSKIIDVNPAFEKLYGWTRKESIGRTLPLVPPHNAEAAALRYNRLLQGESVHVLNTQDMRKDGTLIDVQITLSPIYNSHGEMIASSVISRDNTYQKENERLVMQSEKLKVVGEIAAGLAHEIRNPMTVISGFVQMMNADENFPYKAYSELIETEIERINLIISEFLVLSKPQKELSTKFSINEVLNSVLELFSL